VARLCKSRRIAVDLERIVHDAEQPPLPIDLTPASQGKAPEPQRVGDVRKDGLCGRQTLSVEMAPLRRIDLALHLGSIGFGGLSGAAFKNTPGVWSSGSDPSGSGGVSGRAGRRAWRP
jgi:hypothetical protein